MATVSELVVKIEADSTGLIKGVAAAEKTVDNFGEGTEKAGGKTVDFGRKLEGLQGVAVAVGAGIGIMANAALDVVKQFAQADIAARRLSIAVELNGADGGVERISNLAAEIQNLTGVDGDLVSQMGAELIAQGKSLEQTEALIKAATNLSAVTGADLGTSVKQLTNTYSGMAGMLGRQIPALKDLTEEQLKNGEAIDLINNKYGGFSDRLKTSTDVNIKRAEQAMGDFAEMIGKVLSPVVDMLSTALSGLVAIMNDGGIIIQTVITAAIAGMTAAFASMAIKAGIATLAQLGFMSATMAAAIAQAALNPLMWAGVAVGIALIAGIVGGTSAMLAEADAAKKTAAATKDLTAQEGALKDATIDRWESTEKARKKWEEARSVAEKRLQSETDAIAAAMEKKEKDLNNFLTIRETLLKNNFITTKEYYEQKKEYQQKLIDDIIKEGEKWGGLTATQKKELEDRKSYIKNYQTEIDRITADEVKKAADAEEEKLAKVKKTRGEMLSALEKYSAESNALVDAEVEAVQTETKNAAEQAKIDAKNLMGAIAQISSAALSAAGTFAQKIGGETGKVLTKVVGVAQIAITALMASNPLGWILAGIQTVALFADEIISFFGIETEAQRNAARAAEDARQKDVAARNKIEADAKKRTATRLKQIQIDRAEEIRAAVALGANLVEINRFYDKKMAEEKMNQNQTIIDKNKNMWEKLARFDEAYGRVLTDSQKKRRDQILDDLILFEDRAASSAESLMSSLSDNLKSGGTRASFKDALRTLMKNMAIDAAIIAAGLKSKMESIGGVIADALADGLLTAGELLNIESLTDSIYSTTSTLVQPIVDLFDNLTSNVVTATEAAKIELNKFGVSIGEALIGGFKSGKTRSDFKTTFFEMLKNMAIDAAIIAAGIGAEFEKIGKFITESLSDGIMSAEELSTIDAMSEELYTRAAGVVEPISSVFLKYIPPAGVESKTETRNNSTTVNIYSPTSVTPSQAASIFKQTSREMAFAGAF